MTRKRKKAQQQEHEQHDNDLQHNNNLHQQLQPDKNLQQLQPDHNLQQLQHNCCDEEQRATKRQKQSERYELCEVDRDNNRLLYICDAHVIREFHTQPDSKWRQFATALSATGRLYTVQSCREEYLKVAAVGAVAPVTVAPVTVAAPVTAPAAPVTVAPSAATTARPQLANASVTAVAASTQLEGVPAMEAQLENTSKVKLENTTKVQLENAAKVKLERTAAAVVVPVEFKCHNIADPEVRKRIDDCTEHMLKHFLVHGKTRPKVEAFARCYFEAVRAAEDITGGNFGRLENTYFLTTKAPSAKRILGSELKREEADEIAEELLKVMHVIKVRVVDFQTGELLQL